MRTIKLTLEYDGTQFSGWQIQPSGRTVQHVLENGLLQLTNESIRIMGSGRTDAGVHALGQVASFQTNGKLPVKAFKDGLNGFLPQDVQILKAEEMDHGFNARKDAIRRTYRYCISKKQSVIGRQYSWYYRQALDVSKMQSASDYLVGDHDFSSFCKADPEIDDYISHVFDVHWTEQEDGFCFNISAIRYFRHMIRVIVGTLVQVGTDAIKAEFFKNILDAKDRKFAGDTAPPHGLYLVQVEYP
jgi:tRNA pseudouridine38-40 synthase